MANESITDDIVSDFFKNDELYKQKQVIIERQGSACVKINKLLENASKKGNRHGRPDFIIQYIENPNLIISNRSKS
ncbi:MAG TPA: hypothetical protein LFV90_07200 [Rickettsia endosymbiont of Columbicola hoogstraali]|nr:hypothetical protein [Rickettsia endosymbiont of Columbicola hoogstraali]